MSRLKMAALVAALAVAPIAPALAQEAPAAAAPQLSPADEAFQAQGQAFEAENQAMMIALQAVMTDEALDNATKTARTDAIITQYTPKFEAFAGALKAYLVDLSGRPESAEQKNEILEASESVPAQVLGAPAQIRQSIQAALAAPQQ